MEEEEPLRAESFGEPYAHELPAHMGRKEVAIAGADVAFWRSARSATQHKLIAHELAVVFADCSRGRGESRVSNVGAGGPLPGISEHLLQTRSGRWLRTKFLGFEERPMP